MHYAETNGAHIGTLIVSVCMENDLREYDKDAPDSADEPAPAPATAASLSGVKAYLTEHSAIYSLATVAVHRVPWLERAAAQAGLLVPNLAAIAVSDTSDEAVRSSAGRLRRLLASRRSVILIVPSRSLWTGTDAHRRQAARTHETFVRLLRQAGLRVVDVRVAFERTGNPLGLHFANDGHWNAEGHRLAADALARSMAGT